MMFIKFEKSLSSKKNAIRKLRNVPQVDFIIFLLFAMAVYDLCTWH